MSFENIGRDYICVGFQTPTGLVDLHYGQTRRSAMAHWGFDAKDFGLFGSFVNPQPLREGRDKVGAPCEEWHGEHCNVVELVTDDEDIVGDTYGVHVVSCQRGYQVRMGNWPDGNLGWVIPIARTTDSYGDSSVTQFLVQTDEEGMAWAMSEEGIFAREHCRHSHDCCGHWYTWLAEAVPHGDGLWTVARYDHRNV